MGRHWTGVRGVREYARVKASRLAGKLAWTKWAGRFAGVAGRSALGAVGLGLGAAQLAYEGYKMVKRVRRGRVSKRRARISRPKRVKFTKKMTARPLKRSRMYKALGPRKRARSNVTKSKGGEYSKLSYKVGSKQKFLPFNVLEKVSTGHRILRFQGVNALERGKDPTLPPGFFQCDFLQVGTDAARLYDMPCYVVGLNGTLNVNVSAVPMHRLRMAAGSTVQFNPIAGLGANGVSASTTWTKEYEAPITTTQAMRYFHHKWYDVRLMLHNAKTQPTKWLIQIVSFTEDYLDPYQIIAGTTVTTDQESDRAAFWQDAMRSLVNHPMMPKANTRMRKKGMIVYKSVEVVMQPDSTTAADQSPDHKEVRLFYNDNRTYDYLPYRQAALTQNFTLPCLFGQDTTSTQYEVIPKPMARKYLMIRAMDTTLTSGVALTSAPAVPIIDATGTWDNTPSFDLCLRKKEVFARSN